MKDEIQVVDPRFFDSWDKLLSSSPKSSIFHSSCWAKALAESYDYTPVYFIIVRNGILAGLIPCMEVDSIITGKRGVSLPFTDCCEPIIDDEVDLQNLLSALLVYGKKHRWKYIELRPGDALPCRYAPSSSYIEHTLDLSQDSKDISLRMRSSTMRNVKKAEGSGIKIEIGASYDILKEFYRLNCLTRKEHGLPPQPFLFFEKIYEHIIFQKHGVVVLARHQNVVIAGAVYFHFGEKALYKYGASDKRHLYLRANNLIMWETIQWYKSQGYKELSFGRTESENKGLLQFKGGWGARESPIYYYKYNLNHDAFVKDKLKIRGMHNWIFSRMPVPMLKIVGSMLYRHIG
jgi:GNAT acetyltransferase-like protein